MEMTVVGFMSRQEPDRRQLAEHWAEKCISFFEDPENEREYQEWKKTSERREKQWDESQKVKR